MPRSAPCCDLVVLLVWFWCLWCSCVCFGVCWSVGRVVCWGAWSLVEKEFVMNEETWVLYVLIALVLVAVVLAMSLA